MASILRTTREGRGAWRAREVTRRVESISISATLGSAWRWNVQSTGRGPAGHLIREMPARSRDSDSAK